MDGWMGDRGIVGEGVDGLDAVRSVSLTNALEIQLERLIVERRVLPGERLNENRLAVSFGTSRGPLREALRSLEAKGLLQSIRNRGVFVRRISLVEVLEIYDMRAALFGLAVRLACERMTPVLLEELERLVTDIDAANARGDVESYFAFNYAFHMALVTGSQNGTLSNEYSRFEKKLHLYDGDKPVPIERLVRANEEHREIVAACAAADPDRAYLAAWTHVEASRKRLVGLVEAGA